MMAGSHVALGAAAWIAAAPQLGQPALAPAALGLAVLGALLPDIDHPKSWVGRRLRPLSHAIAAVFGHRGVTHSLVAVAGCGALLLNEGVPRQVVAPLVVGYLSHLLGDLLTPGGLRLAWPFRGTWALPLCRTGSPFEPLVVALALLAAWYLMPARPDPRPQLQRLGLLVAPLPPPPPARPAAPPVKRRPAAWHSASR
ncbi:metal-dependent hydrolase [Siccirubricoccus sp. G192]|uniref:metal-dependent hydrolase n=1 Tax=Siccirubricoccus sp. G192 TaxID=2849651 RepID=UPI001C2CBCDD|nr:metal-dependent hydrolase [Siccirubricoccus sp. G192]MBV1799810.1 metal-dependent hydrolase [Siccirubricoccus sp. G192]